MGPVQTMLTSSNNQNCVWVVVYINGFGLKAFDDPNESDMSNWKTVQALQSVNPWWKEQLNYR